MKKPLTPWIYLLAVLPLLGWWTYGLFDLDEGFYAAVAAEMNRRGEWVIPYYNGHPWFEKPILLYWVAKPSIALFGDMVGPRLPSILATLGTYAWVGWFARRRFPSSELIPVLSVLVLASSLLPVAAGRMMLTDPLLVFCVTGAFTTFWESLVGNPRWRLLTAALLGLGVLAKGPVVGLLFLPVAGWTYWKQPATRPAFRGHWLAGAAIFFAVVASWYLPAYREDGAEFVQKFLIEQNVGRFTGGDQAHTLGGVGGLVFYIPILLVGFLPWSIRLFSAWKHVSPDAEPNVQRYLRSWALTVFLFFTISGAKLPHYILPLFPPLALLVGIDIVQRDAVRKWWPVAIGWTVFIAAFAQWGFSSYYYGLRLGNFELPGFHAEVHRLARFVRSQAKPTDEVAEYQMGRRERELGTGKPKIQETSHPSTLLYLNRDVLDTDDWNAILRQKSPVWVITRWNRVGEPEARAAGTRLHNVETPFAQDLYRLYRVDPAVIP